MRVLKMICPDCASKAIIQKTNRKHRHLSDIYCVCSNWECGHRFVVNATFSHTLVPSALTHGQIMQSFVNSVTPEQRTEAIEWLKAAQEAEREEAKAMLPDPNKPIVTRHRHAN
ncbi:transcriptional regulator [Serratia marcescens]|uniref:ogr/Delta-like zinc finger family protein n=1 Tax=Serratia marcescens TaxID=615 RepID=UPI000B5F855B|nr:ogr/Delta-like zinc finger family protein [Serratia marcescens]ASL93802.1 transcriptional regulator [Serratia marcescens]